MHKVLYFILIIFLNISIFVSSSNIVQEHSFESDTEQNQQQNNSDIDDEFSQINVFYFVRKSNLTLSNIHLIGKIKFHFIEISPLRHFTSPLIKPPIFSV